MAEAPSPVTSSPVRPAGASAGGGVLVLALARAAFGETTLGLRIADDLAAMGHPVHFLVHPAVQKVFGGGGRDVEVLAAERGDALDVRLDAVLRRARPRAILLADLLMAITELRRRHAGPRVLSRFNLPIIGMDPWNLPELDARLDIAPGPPVQVAETAANHPLRVVPVPFARPSAAGAVNLLPRVGDAASRRATTRAAMGLGPADKLVFFASSGWQQRSYGDATVDRVAAGVPRLVGAYLAALDISVLHVGPSPMPWQGLRRYVHRTQLAHEAFLDQLAAADLLLSLNAPATTATAAVALGVPVLTLQNSFVGESLDALWSWLGRRPDPVVVAWAREHVPLYRFLMWPMSAWGMLSKLFEGNPYDGLLNRVEILDAEAVLGGARRLLSGGEDEAAVRGYFEEVRRLPGAAEQVWSLAEGRGG